ncbi:hypothetical protein ES332_D06G193400v1 [Gossypium tomentosum]|uniref:Uncharacterized protein n=1 Tax=Gossypium tomentosum TaxID=34277 RepID=A0A5D2KLI6_GOSTO|nr:hypothetical protein ES332_D06G193400v1 [Gossypium tomentosum]
MQIYIYVYTLVPVNLRVIAIIIFPLLNHMKATKNKHLKLDCQKKKRKKKKRRYGRRKIKRRGAKVTFLILHVNLSYLKINKKAQKSRIPCFVSSLTYIHTYIFM